MDTINVDWLGYVLDRLLTKILKCELRPSLDGSVDELRCANRARRCYGLNACGHVEAVTVRPLGDLEYLTQVNRHPELWGLVVSITALS